MGYQKFATKRQLIDAHRDYIIAEYLGTAAPSRTAASIAKELGVGRTLLMGRIRVWREAGLLEYLTESPLDADRDTISALWHEGISMSEIARKWGSSLARVQAALMRWGEYQPERRTEQEAMPKISLNDLKNQWIDVTERTVVTVGRIPRFYLVPITAEEA